MQIHFSRIIRDFEADHWLKNVPVALLAAAGVYKPYSNQRGGEGGRRGPCPYLISKCSAWLGGCCFCCVVQYSVDSIKRTVHLTFYGLFFLLKILFFFEKLKTVLLIETVRNLSALKIFNTYFNMFVNSRSLY